MPMSTMLEIGSPESSWVKSTWSKISDGARRRTKPAWVEAQKTHPILQPTSVEMQTDCRDDTSSKTVSMQFPSPRRQRYLIRPVQGGDQLALHLRHGDEIVCLQFLPQRFGEVRHFIKGGRALM